MISVSASSERTIYRPLAALPDQTPAAAAELAARLAQLPADSRPRPPTVHQYDALLSNSTPAKS